MHQLRCRQHLSGALVFLLVLLPLLTAASPLPHSHPAPDLARRDSTPTSQNFPVSIVVPILASLLVSGLVAYFIWWNRNKNRNSSAADAERRVRESMGLGAEIDDTPPPPRRRVLGIPTGLGRSESGRSIRTLPIYTKEAGDEEIVLLRRDPSIAPTPTRDDDIGIEVLVPTLGRLSRTASAPTAPPGRRSPASSPSRARPIRSQSDGHRRRLSAELPPPSPSSASNPQSTALSTIPAEEPSAPGSRSGSQTGSQNLQTTPESADITTARTPGRRRLSAVAEREELELRATGSRDSGRPPPAYASEAGSVRRGSDASDVETPAPVSGWTRFLGLFGAFAPAAYPSETRALTHTRNTSSATVTEAVGVRREGVTRVVDPREEAPPGYHLPSREV